MLLSLEDKYNYLHSVFESLEDLLTDREFVANKKIALAQMLSIVRESLKKVSNDENQSNEIKN